MEVVRVKRELLNISRVFAAFVLMVVSISGVLAIQGTAIAEDCQNYSLSWSKGQERYQDPPQYFFGVSDDFLTFEIYSKDNFIASATSKTAKGVTKTYSASDTFKGEGKNLVRTISGDSFTSVSGSINSCQSTSTPTSPTPGQTTAPPSQPTPKPTPKATTQAPQPTASKSVSKQSTSPVVASKPIQSSTAVEQPSIPRTPSAAPRVTSTAVALPRTSSLPTSSASSEPALSSSTKPELLPTATRSSKDGSGFWLLGLVVVAISALALSGYVLVRKFRAKHSTP